MQLHFARHYFNHRGSSMMVDHSTCASHKPKILFDGAMRLACVTLLARGQCKSLVPAKTKVKKNLKVSGL
jgi:hypothetical protein